MLSHPSLSLTVSHTPSLEKSPYSLPSPTASREAKRRRQSVCGPGDASRAVFLVAAYPCTETALTTFGKTSPQTVSIKPKQVPLTELPLFGLYGVHTWASVGWTCYHLTPKAQVKGTIKTHIKDAFFHCDGWKSHSNSGRKNISSLAVLYLHRSVNCSLALK